MPRRNKPCQKNNREGETMGCTFNQNIDPNVEERIAHHPCYSEEAHHYFARMHVAVAPACNIQCNYCNRKFDCANESRPGVVSELLKPEEAVKKVLVVAGEIPQMSVLGIAGPGDPLANPERTFETFRRVAEEAPDIKLCLSTNGLRLLDYIDQIEELNVDHVTITINAVDPQVGQHIYSFIYFEGKRYTGLEAATILLDRQLRGLEELIKRNILVKVNSVYIPGVNDVHLEEVSKEVKKRGAFIHNIMPLIVAPDTVFEKQGIQNPSPEDIQNIREKCSGTDITMMKHCRQCRADAVGLLGEDRSEEFTKEKIMNMEVKYDMESRRRFQEDLDNKIAAKKERRMQRLITKNSDNSSTVRIALTTRGEAKVNLHFGHAKEFLVFDVTEDSIKFIGVRKVQSYCIGIANCGTNKGPILSETAEILKDCKILLSSGIGERPRRYLTKRGIVPYVKSGNIEDLLYESRKYYTFLNQSTLSKI